MEVQQFVSITPWTMIFQICNLLILTLLLKKFLFKPVQNILSQRQQEIDDTYGRAQADRNSAARMKEEVHPAAVLRARRGRPAGAFGRRGGQPPRR